MKLSMPQIVYIVGTLIIIATLWYSRRDWWPALRHAVPAVARIAGITVGEARRRKVLQVGLIFVILIIGSMGMFTYLSPAEEDKMLIDGGLASITFFGMLLSIFVGAFLIPTEVERRTIYSLLSKPVKRFEFVLGKYVGAMVVVGILVAVMAVAHTLVLALRVQAFNPHVLAAAALTYCALGVFLALIVMISAVSSTTMAVVGGFIIWGIGSLQSTIQYLSEHAQVKVSSAILNVAYLIIPKFENFDFRRAVALGDPVSGTLAFDAVLHGIGYTLIVLILAVIFFNDRQV